MNIDFKDLRPPDNYPVYPPYHKGEYLEEYFYNFYKKNKYEFDKIQYTYIPIFWTSIYVTGVNVNLIQPYLDSLPPDNYFTVSQHDDAVKETLPLNTISFEAGGNKSGIPIPLICSPLPSEYIKPTVKDIFCSFTGSLTHEIRTRIHNLYSGDRDFVFYTRWWTQSVGNSELSTFLNITQRSKFTLCPRGYGAQSFRLYEVLQLNSVPVIIYDKEWFPFNDRINWSSFCVLVHFNEIHNLKSKLLSITDEKYSEMITAGKQIYNTYLTLEGMSYAILNTLKIIKTK